MFFPSLRAADRTFVEIRSLCWFESKSVHSVLSFFSFLCLCVFYWDSFASPLDMWLQNKIFGAFCALYLDWIQHIGVAVEYLLTWNHIWWNCLLLKPLKICTSESHSPSLWGQLSTISYNWYVDLTLLYRSIYIHQVSEAIL